MNLDVVKKILKPRIKGMTQVRVSFDGNMFLARCEFSEKEIPKSAGFRWNDIYKKWYTKDYGIAARLSMYFDETAKKEINRKLIAVKSYDGPISFPSNGQTPYQFQLDAARFALSRNRSYLALDPGLGKTIIAALVSNVLRSQVVYICPPFLCRNVQNEFEKWAFSIKGFTKANCERLTKAKAGNVDVLLVPDSLLMRETTINAIAEFSRRAPTILFVDEAHRYKNDDAKRTKALFREIVTMFERVTFLSGTPMPNRPMELFPILSNCAPETIDFQNRFQFGVKYCAGFESAWGWDFSGASNVQELGARVKDKFMLRIRKDDALDLPERVEEMVILENSMPPALLELDRKLLTMYSPEDLMNGGGEHIATYRRVLGEHKVDACGAFIQNLLDDNADESILIFAYHKAVIAKLTTLFADYAPLVIDGSVPTEKRVALAEEFQRNKKRRIMILQITAGGVGFNLQKASRVVFVEFAWTPSDNDQAIDRAHRIGQGSRVIAQYLVYKNSIDATVLQTNLYKRKAIKHI